MGPASPSTPQGPRLRRVDELNALLGLVIQANPVDAGRLTRIQNDLFDVGGDLCIPQTDDEKPGHALRVQASQAERLEREIDQRNEQLRPLESFILPGGSAGAAWLHLARTVCRRAERAVTSLMETEKVNPNVLVYLNRLSDLLFVMARVANDDGKADVLWVPGKSRVE